MSIENIIRNRDALLITGGKQYLNLKHPKEFELYMCALELMDDAYDTLRYFIFPVMPSSIDENKPQITNIKKTLSGISVLSTPTFVPTDITLSGNFGVKFKVLLGDNYTDIVSSFSTSLTHITKQSVGSDIKSFFDERVKTGYGCLKILEEIIDLSNSMDSSGGVRKLLLHNPALGNSYLVKAINLRFSQSEDSNMVWNYNLQLKSIAPLDSLGTRKQLEGAEKNLIINGFIQKRVDGLINSVSKFAAQSEINISNKATQLIQS